MQAKSANILFVKTAIVIVVFCLAECAAGSKHPKSSCLKYGHSCWGGHGKRSGGVANGGEGGGGGLIRVRSNEGPGNVVNTRWYLSRLVQAPADLRLWRDERDRHIMVTRNSQDRHIQNDSEIDPDFAKRPEDSDDLNAVESLPEDSDTEEVVLMEEPSQTLGQKLRLYKLMKKSVDKLN